MRVTLNFQYYTILYVIFFSIVLFGCKKEKKQNHFNNKKNVSVSNNSSIINSVCEQININYERKDYAEFSVFKLFGEDLIFEMILIDTQEKALLKVNNHFYLTHLNFTYETDKKTSISDIKVFNCGNNIQTLLLPLSTEELLTYQVIELNNTTHKNLGMLSYENVDLGKLFNVNSSNKLEKNKDGYIFKIINNDTNKPLVIYDELSPLDNFKDVNQVYPKVETYLNIRSGPNIENSKVIGKAYPNDKLFVLSDINKKWVLIYFNNSFGYVYRGFLFSTNLTQNR
ncbi:SH3 domain-containing protein [Aurantibacter sp.]|uniref:SH3 domain-containing protein n=1 Tax=Aurantibacter sp. TaxID=2807103 RepID=UPI0035C79C8C